MTADLDPHIATIRKALIEQRGDIFAAIGYQTTVTASDEMVVELAAIDAALATLDTLTTPPPVDEWEAVPDGKYISSDGHHLRVGTVAGKRGYEYLLEITQRETGKSLSVVFSANRVAFCRRRTPTPPPMPSAIPDDVREIMALWADRVEGRAKLLLGTTEDVIGRMALDEVARINAWLDEQQRPPTTQDDVP